MMICPVVEEMESSSYMDALSGESGSDDGDSGTLAKGGVRDVIIPLSPFCLMLSLNFLSIVRRQLNRDWSGGVLIVDVTILIRLKPEIIVNEVQKIG